MTLAVSISARELSGRHLVRRIEQALQRHDFDPARLVLVTEGVPISVAHSLACA